MQCALCGRAQSAATLAEASWLDPRVIERLSNAHPHWKRTDGACPACVQDAILESLLTESREALGGRVQSAWPLDAQAAFGALPTPLRLRADPRYSGRGVTIALVDAAFHPHPDLVRPDNRIRVWVDATREDTTARWFDRDDVPVWPETPAGNAGAVWHGLMTSVTAAGSGWLSHGLYRGIASASDLAFVQVSDSGEIGDAAIVRALRWLRDHAVRLNLRVISLSVAGDEVSDSVSDIDREVAALVEDGIVVVAAAGNDGVRHLLPPATAREAITVGGIDDHSVLDASAWELWHSNYGSIDAGIPKPEVVAPSLWCVAPILPGSEVAREARALFELRARGRRDDIDRRIADLHLVTPFYQHVEGTSFAAPLVASVVACMLEANPRLRPARVKELLMTTATRVASAPDERQGAGVVDAGLAIAAALADGAGAAARPRGPRAVDGTILFELHDSIARSVAVRGSWDDWRAPGTRARQVRRGLWQATLPTPSQLPNGNYCYKYVIDDERWLPDPANPVRRVDDSGNVNSVLKL